MFLFNYVFFCLYLQIERLKEEKESLASQSVRPAAEGQENGDVHAEHTPAPDTALLQSL